MSQRDAAAGFEAALLGAVRSSDNLANEPALESFRVFLMIMQQASDPDLKAANRARSLMHELHRAYEYVRLHDDNSNPRKPKGVTRFKPEYLPESLAGLRVLVAQLWPLLPFVSFVYYTRGSRTWGKQKSARMYEYIFVLLCTKPRVMRPWLYDLAAFVIGQKRSFPQLDVHVAAEAVVATFERRALPVARYKAKAKTIEEAAKRVRIYMTGAIRRRLNDVLRAQLKPEIGVPASTARRWSKEREVTVSSASEEAAMRREMAERRRHFPDGCVSVAVMAKAFKRSRTTITKVLRDAEQAHGFTAERGPDRTFWVTHAQAKLVGQRLPPRRRAARSK